jgi:hypothetical protein
MAGLEGEALPLVECEPIVSSSLIVKYVGFSEATAERFRVADTAQRSIRVMLQTGAASLENLVPMAARDTGQQPTLNVCESNCLFSMTMRYLILMFRYMYRLIDTVVVKSLQ